MLQGKITFLGWQPSLPILPQSRHICQLVVASLLGFSTHFGHPPFQKIKVFCQMQPSLHFKITVEIKQKQMYYIMRDIREFYYKINKGFQSGYKPQIRACPRATQQGYAKRGGTSPLRRSWCRKKFWRKADNLKKIIEVYYQKSLSHIKSLKTI